MLVIAIQTSLACSLAAQFRALDPAADDAGRDASTQDVRVDATEQDAPSEDVASNDTTTIDARADTGPCGSGQGATMMAGRVLCGSAPRNIAPLSQTILHGSRARFLFENPSNGAGVTLQISEERGFVDNESRLDVIVAAGVGEVEVDLAQMRGSVAPLANALRNKRRVYWRLTGATNTPAWLVRVLPNSVVVEADAAVRARRATTTWGALTDINIDGNADIVVGEPGASSAPGGAAQVVLSMPDQLGMMPRFMDPPLRAPAANPAVQFGSIVSAAGDVNGDGHADIVVASSPLERNPRMFLFRGSDRGLASTAPQEVVDTLNTQLGYAIASAGDFDQDGYGDVVVGAPRASGAGAGDDVGRVRVYWGSAAGIDTSAPLELSPSLVGGALRQERFGTSVSGACDVNNDGVHDIIVGAPGAPGVAPAVYVFFGSAGSRTASRVARDLRPSGESRFGAVVRCVGDITRDGVADFIASTLPNGGRSSVVVYPGVGAPSLAATLGRLGSATIALESNEPVRQLLPAFDLFSESAALSETAGELDVGVIVSPPAASNAILHQLRGFAPMLSSPPFDASSVRIASLTSEMALDAESVGAFSWLFDGNPLFAIGAPNQSTGAGARAGRVYLMGTTAGSSDGVRVRSLMEVVVLDGTAANGRLGASIAH